MPEWNKKSARTVEVDYFAWDKVSSARSDKTPPTDKYLDVQLYDDAEFDDEKLFREYLSRALTSTNEIAFCSNVDRIQPVEEKIYTAVTTSAKNIAALKKNAQEQRPPIVQPEKNDFAETSRYSYAVNAYKSQNAAINNDRREISVDNFVDWLIARP